MKIASFKKSCNTIMNELNFRECWKVVLCYVYGKSLCRLCQCSTLFRYLVEQTPNYHKFIREQKFNEGRIHQLVIETEYIHTLSINELLNSRLYLTYLRNYKIPIYAGTVKYDYFYIGRCIEFIRKESGILIPSWAFSPRDYHYDNVVLHIITMAHEIKQDILQPKEGDRFNHIYCECRVFVAGSKTCVCGKKKLEFTKPNNCQNLDADKISIGIRISTDPVVQGMIKLGESAFTSGLIPAKYFPWI